MTGAKERRRRSHRLVAVPGRREHAAEGVPPASKRLD